MLRQTRDLIELLPFRVQERFRSSLDYAEERLEDIAIEDNITEQQLDKIQLKFELIFLLRLIYGYYVHNFYNYQDALNYLGGLGVKGFQIGSTSFDRTTSVNFDWLRLAKALEDIVDSTDSNKYVRPSVSVDSAIRLILNDAHISGEI